MPEPPGDQSPVSKRKDAEAPCGIELTPGDQSPGSKRKDVEAPCGIEQITDEY